MRHYFAGLGAGLLLQMASSKLIPETYDGWTMAGAVLLMSYPVIMDLANKD